MFLEYNFGVLLGQIEKELAELFGLAGKAPAGRTLTFLYTIPPSDSNGKFAVGDCLPVPVPTGEQNPPFPSPRTSAVTIFSVSHPRTGNNPCRDPRSRIIAFDFVPYHHTVKHCLSNI